MYRRSNRSFIPSVAILALFALATSLMTPSPISADSPPAGGAAADEASYTIERGEGPFAYELMTLENGMRVITLADNSAPVASILVWYEVGAKDEKPNRRGFAHMFEHMMFRGTERVANGEHDKYIKRAGGTMNAYTSFDETVYLQTIPAHEVELVLWLESERMGFLQIDEEGFHTERDVVIEEYRVGRERPYGGAFDKLLPEVFQGGLYSWSPIGSPNELRASTVAELQDFWNKYYVPNNATLIVVGDIDHANVQALARKYFGWMPSFPAPPAPSVERAPEPDGPRTIRIKERKAPVPIAGIGWRTPPAGHEDQLALSMVTSILGTGESSRLYRRLVIEDELATAAFAGTFGLADDGLAGVGASLKPMGSDIPGTMAALREEVARFIADGPTEEEMTKALNAELLSMIASRRTVMGQASTLGTANATWGDLSRVNTVEADVRALTAEDLRAAAEKWLAPDREIEVIVEQNLLGTLFGGGTDENDSPDAAVETDTESVDDATTGSGKPGLVRPDYIPAAPPEAGKLTADLTIDAPTRTLDNGLEVVVITDHEIPMVSFLLGVEVGTVHDLADAPGTAALAADMLTRGTESRDYETLSRVLDQNAISLSASVDREESSVSASALVEYSDLAMELLADALLHPAFPENEFLTLKGQLSASLAVQETDPNYVAGRAMRQAAWGDHPYSRSSRPELADLPAITVDGMREWWSTHMQPGRATLYVVGALDPEEAFALAEKHLGGWSTEAEIAEPEWNAPPAIEGRRVILVDMPGDQAQIRVGHHGFLRQDDSYIPGRVLSQILGGGFNSRLTDRVRGELGLTYGIGGGFSSDPQAGSFRVSTFTKNESVGEALEAIFDVLESMQTEAPGDEELTIARNTIVGAFVRGRETPMAKAMSLWQIRTEKLPADFPTQVLEGVQATTADDVMKVATERMHPNDSIILVVGPADQLRDQLAPFGEIEVITPKGEPVEDAE